MKHALRIFAVALILAAGAAKVTATVFDGPEPTPDCDPNDPKCKVVPPASLALRVFDGPEPTPDCDPNDPKCKVVPPKNSL
jgi:hypothetical protein